jgi:hypothetical protein
MVWSALDRSTDAAVTVRVVGRSSDGSRRDELLVIWEEQLARREDRTAAVVAFGTVGDDDVWVAYSGDLEPLGARLAHRNLTLDEWMELARSLIDSLDELHRRDRVHGGVLPGSVLAGDDGWLLSDVGVMSATLLRQTDISVGTKGQHARVAPELLGGGVTTTASDVYFLGVLLADSSRGITLPGVVQETLQSAVAQVDRRASLDDLRAVLDSVQERDRRPEIFDDDVRFTVYRPNLVAPGVWSTLIAFAHKTETTVDPNRGEVDPIAEVDRQAREALGSGFNTTQLVASDADQSIFRGAELRLVPEATDVDFNPPWSTFRWLEPIHRQDFRFRASPALDGSRARGTLTVYLGTLIIAELAISFRVESTISASIDTDPDRPESARPYRKVFASYSHTDVALVEQVEAVLHVVDNEFLRDSTHVRAGEVWSTRIEELIREADIFELFWSTASMVSEFVRHEWTYALSLNRGHRFVRPVFWEDPFPERPDQGLPPPELRSLHFARLPVAVAEAEPADSKAMLLGAPHKAPQTVQNTEPTGSRQSGALICGRCGESNPPDQGLCRFCGEPLPTGGVVKRSWTSLLRHQESAGTLEVGERLAKAGTHVKENVGRQTMRALRKIVTIVAIIVALVALVPPVRNWTNDTIIHRGSGRSNDFATEQFEPVIPQETLAAGSMPASGRPPGPSTTLPNPATNATDRAGDTFWVAPPDGGESVLLVTFGQLVDLDRAVIQNGARDAFAQFSRAHELHLVFDTGKWSDINLMDVPQPQNVSVSNGHGITRVEIYIVSIFPAIGNPTPPVAISEIEFFHQK